MGERNGSGKEAAVAHGGAPAAGRCPIRGPTSPVGALRGEPAEEPRLGGHRRPGRLPVPRPGRRRRRQVDPDRRMARSGPPGRSADGRGGRERRPRSRVRAERPRPSTRRTSRLVEGLRPGARPAPASPAGHRRPRTGTARRRRDRVAALPDGHPGGVRSRLHAARRGRRGRHRQPRQRRPRRGPLHRRHAPAPARQRGRGRGGAQPGVRRRAGEAVRRARHPVGRPVPGHLGTDRPPPGRLAARTPRRRLRRSPARRRVRPGGPGRTQRTRLGHPSPGRRGRPPRRLHRTGDPRTPRRPGRHRPRGRRGRDGPVDAAAPAGRPARPDRPPGRRRRRRSRRRPHRPRGRTLPPVDPRTGPPRDGARRGTAPPAQPRPVRLRRPGRRHRGLGLAAEPALRHRPGLLPAVPCRRPGEHAAPPADALADGLDGGALTSGGALHGSPGGPGTPAPGAEAEEGRPMAPADAERDLPPALRRPDREPGAGPGTRRADHRSGSCGPARVARHAEAGGAGRRPRGADPVGGEAARGSRRGAARGGGPHRPLHPRAAAARTGLGARRARGLPLRGGACGGGRRRSRPSHRAHARALRGTCVPRPRPHPRHRRCAGGHGRPRRRPRPRPRGRLGDGLSRRAPHGCGQARRGGDGLHGRHRAGARAGLGVHRPWRGPPSRRSAGGGVGGLHGGTGDDP